MAHPAKLFYKDMESLVGVIRLIATVNGLTAILWAGEDYKRTKLSNPEQDNHAPILVQTEQQLNEYFYKKRTVFDIPFSWLAVIFKTCHRIIGASGKLGSFAGGSANKLILLGLEEKNRTPNHFYQ